MPGVVLGYYEKRWLIEEWHKALKTGCRVEHRQLKTKERLERITALLSVVSVRLLQLKSAARTTPERPATEVVPVLWITMLQAAQEEQRSEGNPQQHHDDRRVLPRTGQARRLPRPQMRWRTRLDHHLARLAEAIPAWSVGPNSLKRSKDQTTSRGRGIRKRPLRRGLAREEGPVGADGGGSAIHRCTTTSRYHSVSLHHCIELP